MSHIVDRARSSTGGRANGAPGHIAEAYHIAREEHLVPPTMEQPEYNMFHRERVEREYLPLYEEMGLGTTDLEPAGERTS